MTKIVDADLRWIVRQIGSGRLHFCLDFLGSLLDRVPHPTGLHRLDFPSSTWIVPGKEGQGVNIEGQINRLGL